MQTLSASKQVSRFISLLCFCLVLQTSYSQDVFRLSSRQDDSVSIGEIVELSGTESGAPSVEEEENPNDLLLRALPGLQLINSSAILIPTFDFALSRYLESDAPNFKYYFSTKVFFNGPLTFDSAKVGGEQLKVFFPEASTFGLRFSMTSLSKSNGKLGFLATADFLSKEFNNNQPNLTCFILHPKFGLFFIPFQSETKFNVYLNYNHIFVLSGNEAFKNYFTYDKSHIGFFDLGFNIPFSLKISQDKPEQSISFDFFIIHNSEDVKKIANFDGEFIPSFRIKFDI